MKRGFSLTEILTVISIVALTAAISTPALFKARDAAKVTQCSSNLRQLALAIELYRNRESANVDYGVPTDMGLPITAAGATLPIVFRCQARPEGVYTQFWPALGQVPQRDYEAHLQQWLGHVTKREASTVFLFDENHTKFPQSEWESAFAIGISLDHSLVKRRHVGFASRPNWWYD